MIEGREDDWFDRRRAKDEWRGRAREMKVMTVAEFG